MVRDALVSLLPVSTKSWNVWFPIFTGASNTVPNSVDTSGIVVLDKAVAPETAIWNAKRV
ncbi:hypothetical protein N7499_005137 [Penicillium canescens]|nr:hypothetical protein N7522_004482 [Penicillium canescens]KAJ6085508.1 hypothetical protein N7499_005137 [Penicillium canescens]